MDAWVYKGTIDTLQVEGEDGPTVELTLDIGFEATMRVRVFLFGIGSMNKEAQQSASRWLKTNAGRPVIAEVYKVTHGYSAYIKAMEGPLEGTTLNDQIEIYSLA